MKPGFTISPSVDGQALTLLAEIYGCHVVRGPVYTPVCVPFVVYNAIVKEGISPTIAPDGCPRGPRFVMKPGSIFTAQISGKAEVPIAYAASSAKLLRTWDKFVIPLPFARLRIAIGEFYFPPKRMTEEEMEAAQEELERRLHETFKIAERAPAHLCSWRLRPFDTPVERRDLYRADSRERLLDRRFFGAILVDAIFHFDLNRCVRDAEVPPPAALWCPSALSPDRRCHLPVHAWSEMYLRGLTDQVCTWCTSRIAGIFCSSARRSSP